MQINKKLESISIDAGGGRQRYWGCGRTATKKTTSTRGGECNHALPPAVKQKEGYRGCRGLLMLLKEILLGAFIVKRIELCKVCKRRIFDALRYDFDTGVPARFLIIQIDRIIFCIFWLDERFIAQKSKIWEFHLSDVGHVLSMYSFCHWISWIVDWKIDVPVIMYNH